MTARAVIGWVIAALLGLVLAAAVTLAASQLSSQRIGLSGEPQSAGQELVPHAGAAPAPGHRIPAGRHHRRPTAARPATPPAAALGGGGAAGEGDGAGDD